MSLRGALDPTNRDAVPRGWRSRHRATRDLARFLRLLAVVVFGLTLVRTLALVHASRRIIDPALMRLPVVETLVAGAVVAALVAASGYGLYLLADIFDSLDR